MTLAGGGSLLSQFSVWPNKQELLFGLCKMTRYAAAMIHEAATPEEYLNALANDWRKRRLLEIRNLLLAVPGSTECLRYKMLGYDLNGKHLAVLNAQKGYVSLYMDPLSELDPNDTLLEGMDYGRSCLRVKKRTDMLKVKALIENRAAILLDETS